MKEVTDELYLNAIRTSAEIVEELAIEQVNSSIMKFDEVTKRAILSQKLAKEMMDTIAENVKDNDISNKTEG